MWFDVEGDKHLTPLESLTLSVSNIKDMKESLDQFLKESVVNILTRTNVLRHISS